MSGDGDAFESWPVRVLHDGAPEQTSDAVAVEEPLQILLAVGAAASPGPLTVTMRTPGHDVELAAGLLYAEGIVSARADIIEISPSPDVDGGAERNKLVVRLRDGIALDATRSARTFMATAACGVCGKTTVDGIFATRPPVLPTDGPRVARALLEALPARMRHAQSVFAKTGGVHAAALFDADGALWLVREDVGRHNAVDKVVGARVLDDRLPASDAILVVSGRAGFEIVQKALQAGIPILAAVGAPSSLSLRLAARAGMTLAGFVRPGRCNVYTGGDRIID